MTKDIHWINNPEHTPSDLDGRSVELHIYQKTPRFTADGIGRMRIEYHPVTSGLFCIWVAYTPSPAADEIEMALDDIDEHHLRPHPEPSKADYLCDAKYPY
jgi:hypothetical protein